MQLEATHTYHAARPSFQVIRYPRCRHMCRIDGLDRGRKVIPSLGDVHSDLANKLVAKLPTPYMSSCVPVKATGRPAAMLLLQEMKGGRCDHVVVGR